MVAAGEGKTTGVSTSTHSEELTQSRFDRFAEAASRFVSQPAFFIVSLIAVVVWLPTLAVIPSVDTWQLVINTVTSVLAFLLIALLQNSERRYDIALHRKVDALARGLAMALEQQARDHRADSGVGAEADEIERAVDELCSTVGLERRI